VKAFVSIKYHADRANRGRIEAIASALGACGLESVCVARDIEGWGAVSLPPAALMRRTFEAMRSCHLVVVDLTEKGVGVGIEAGYAYAGGLPILTIAQEGAMISETLRGVSQGVYVYRSVDDLGELLRRVVPQVLS
jgi:nucleoside 2-deoxyribosyltransferase